VRTNAQAIGANARIVIDQQTGNVIEATFAPR
jgi:D-alanyl-D-alanine carboxypeptidase